MCSGWNRPIRWWQSLRIRRILPADEPFMLVVVLLCLLACLPLAVHPRSDVWDKFAGCGPSFCSTCNVHPKIGNLSVCVSCTAAPGERIGPHFGKISERSITASETEEKQIRNGERYIDSLLEL